MTVTCVYPEDIKVLEDALIDVLTDITISKCTKEQVDGLINYLEENECDLFN